MSLGGRLETPPPAKKKKLSPRGPALVNEMLEPSLLISILQKVSERTGGLSQALVCKQWLRLSSAAQSRVRIRPGASLSGAQLVDLVNSFECLRTLELSEASVTSLEDVPFQNLAPRCSTLKALKIERSAFVDVYPVAGGGLSSLLHYTTNLTSLDLSFSHLLGFSFSVPESISRLTMLTSLTCKTVQSVPGSLSMLTSLKRLTLWSDVLCAPPPAVFQLTGLTHLSMHFSKMTDLTQGIGSLSHLLELDISSDQLRQLPGSLLTLTQLQHLQLKCDALRALPEGMDWLKGLRSLEIPACTNLAELPACLLRLRNLTFLDCGNVLHTLPGGAAGLNFLKGLRISFLEDGDVFPPGIEALASTLQSLSFECCGLLKTLPREVCSLSELRNLEIDCCIELTSLPAELCNLKKLKRLKLSSLPKVTSVPKSLGQMTSLEVLILQSLDSVRTLPRSLLGLAGLRKLSFRFCSSLSLPGDMLEVDIWRKALEAGRESLRLGYR